MFHIFTHFELKKWKLCQGVFVQHGSHSPGSPSCSMPRGLGRGVKGTCKGRGNSGNLERRFFLFDTRFWESTLSTFYVFFLCIFCGIFGGFDNVRSRWIWINFSDLDHDGVKEGLNRNAASGMSEEPPDQISSRMYIITHHIQIWLQFAAFCH